MPILDPSLQLALVNQFKNDVKSRFLANFLLNLLQISSKFTCHSRKNIEASIKFKKYLPKYLPFLNEQLKSKITEEEIRSQKINNIYQFLLDKIKPNAPENKRNDPLGQYFICTDKYHTKLFQPSINQNETYSWFLSDTPIAILCIRNDLSDDSTYYKMKLEIDLFYSAGFTLILCVTDHKANIFEFCKQLIIDNQFSEVHLNCNNFFQEHLRKHDDFSIFKQYNGYLYLYIRFFDKNNEELYLIKKLFKQLSHIKIISFTGDNFNNIKNENIKLIDTKPFGYCTNGFDFDYLRIMLSNIPLYDSENDNDSIIPSQTSGISIGYIHPNDFLNFKKNRIKILTNDRENQNHYFEKYVNFEDIHLIRPDLYVQDQLSLARIDEKTLEEVTKIEEKINKKIDKRINKKKKFFSFIF